MAESEQQRGTLLTLNLKPRQSEAIKPAELIQVTGHHDLTLNARRAITILWHHAHMQGVEEGRDYSVEIDELKPDGHKGYEMVEEAIETLMRTILTVRMTDGKTRRVQFLGGNDLDDPDRPAGVLTYSFDKRLVEVLKESSIWGKIAIPILMAFTSKYAVSLYENAAQFSNLEYKTYADYSIDEFRNLVGVQPGQYKTFGEFNKHVLKPAVGEVNALAPFSLTVLPTKQGKKVTGVRVSWWRKEGDALAAAWDEVRRPKVGRKARIAETVEQLVTPPVQSVGRMMRTSRIEHAKRSPKTS